MFLNTTLPPLSALSLFSGAGGMDIGVRKAGFKVLATVEQDKHCCATLRQAVTREQLKTQVIETDVREIDPRTLMKRLSLFPGELDLLFGGPPCQAFSQIGKQQGIEDERGLLLFEMVRFARVFQPKSILIEQVKGLVSAKDAQGQKGGILAHLLDDLEALKYRVTWQVLNAADYGVPQRRQRIFIVAVRPDVHFDFPTPTHAPNGEYTLFATLLPYMTVGDAISNLKPYAPKGTDRPDSHVDVTPNRDRFRIHGVPEGSYLAAQRHLPPKPHSQGYDKVPQAFADCPIPYLAMRRNLFPSFGRPLSNSS